MNKLVGPRHAWCFICMHLIQALEYKHRQYG